MNHFLEALKVGTSETDTSTRFPKPRRPFNDLWLSIVSTRA